MERNIGRTQTTEAANAIKSTPVLLTENSMAHIRTSHSAMNEPLCNGVFVYESYTHLRFDTIDMESADCINDWTRGRMRCNVLCRCALRFSRAAIAKIIRRLFTYIVRSTYLHSISHHVVFNIEINRGYSCCSTNSACRINETDVYIKKKIKWKGYVEKRLEKDSEIIVLIACRKVRKLSCSREFKTRTRRVTCIQ